MSLTSASVSDRAPAAQGLDRLAIVLGLFVYAGLLGAEFDPADAV